MPAETGLRIAVVGGGIAGLAAAHEVGVLRPDAEVLLFEAGQEIGGKLRRRDVGGVTVDVGAESMLARRPEAVDFAKAVGLGDSLVTPATASAMLWSRSRLVPLPRTMMGVPADSDDLADVVTRKARMRVAVESKLPAPVLAGADVSIGRLVEERLGKEVVDRLVEPLLGGVYAGRAREISARAAVPQLMAKVDDGVSLTAAAAQLLAASAGSTTPVFAGIDGGVARLAEAAATSGRFSIELGAHVRDLVRREGGWSLVLGEDAATARIVDIDAVVLATPPRATARLLSDVAPAAALELARVESASVAVVTMAFPARDFPPVTGSGFLVPAVDDRQIKAATFSFQKWDWVADAGGDLVLMRCSLGRHREAAVLQFDDAEIVDIAIRDLGRAIGLSVRPVATDVQRWFDGLPQYAVGHLDLVSRIRADIAPLPGVSVCGATYDGVGIPAVIASARRAAAEVLAAQLPA